MGTIYCVLGFARGGKNGKIKPSTDGWCDYEPAKIGTVRSCSQITYRIQAGIGGFGGALRCSTHGLRSVP
ncbi:MAG: hypothetical protein MK130_05620 [Puniceicoccaceae bacterium]|nr:hypothetical protein [Puniceicoccaceae bacterium]